MIPTKNRSDGFCPRRAVAWKLENVSWRWCGTDEDAARLALRHPGDAKYDDADDQVRQPDVAGQLVKAEQPGRDREKYRKDVIVRKVQLHGQPFEQAEFVVGKEGLDEHQDANRPRHANGWAAEMSEAEYIRNDDQENAYGIVQNAVRVCWYSFHKATFGGWGAGANGEETHRRGGKKGPTC